MLKRVGASTQSCFTPLLIPNAFEVSPTNCTVLSMPSWKDLIRLNSFGGQPMIGSILKRPSLLTKNLRLVMIRSSWCQFLDLRWCQDTLWCFLVQKNVLVTHSSWNEHSFSSLWPLSLHFSKPKLPRQFGQASLSLPTLALKYPVLWDFPVCWYLGWVSLVDGKMHL